MNIGDRIVVKVKSVDNWIHRTAPFRIDEFEGTVVKGNPTLDPPGTFNLLTGNREYPVSIIALHNVVEWKKVGGVKGAPIKNRTRYILVRTNHGTEHRVSIHSSGHLMCDCASFSFRKSCSHTKDALAHLIVKYGADWTNVVFN